jgi:hypothetical protein
MPASKKRKTAKKAVSVATKKVEKMSEQSQMLLFVFAIAMMAFAYVLYKVYAQ